MIVQAVVEGRPRELHTLVLEEALSSRYVAGLAVVPRLN